MPLTMLLNHRVPEPPSEAFRRMHASERAAGRTPKTYWVSARLWEDLWQELAAGARRPWGLRLLSWRSADVKKYRHADRRDRNLVMAISTPGTNTPRQATTYEVRWQWCRKNKRCPIL